MANQFSRRGPPDKIKKGHSEASKDKMRAEYLARRMFKFAKAKGQDAEKLFMSPAQVQAAKVLIERGKPALQAIEQREDNPWERLTPEEIGEQIKALITAHPELIRLVQPGPKPVSDSQQEGEKAA